MNKCSEVSDSGHSRIRIVSLQRTQLEVPRIPAVSIHAETPKEEILLTKDKQAVLKCTIFGDATVNRTTIICTFSERKINQMKNEKYTYHCCQLQYKMASLPLSPYISHSLTSHGKLQRHRKRMYTEHCVIVSTIHIAKRRAYIPPKLSRNIQYHCMYVCTTDHITVCTYVVYATLYDMYVCSTYIITVCTYAVHTVCLTCTYILQTLTIQRSIQVWSIPPLLS